MFKTENNSNKYYFSNFKNLLFQNSKNKVDYAIISAMPEELEFFLTEFANLNFSSVKIGEFDFKIFEYQNSKVLIAHTGMGTAFAASVLTFIYSYFSPDYFLISGTAGAIKNGLKLRDVIIAENAFEAEIQDAFTLLKDTPFESALTQPTKNKCFPAQYSADSELLNICDNLNFTDTNVYKGLVVSSNAFPAPKELFDKIKKSNPYCIDMETSAFYQTAWLLNTKAIAIRGISNILNSDGTDEKVHESDLKGSALAASKVLLAILNKVIFLKNQSKEIQTNVLEDEAERLVSEFNLQPHPEGGYYAAIYKSSDLVTSINPNKYENETRSAGTSIYYLLNKKDYSAWHTLKSDEIWHFYKGSPVNIYVIDEDGKLNTYLLGDALTTKGASFQVCIKAGTYFAAENTDKNSYSLVGCTVSPGFEYSDFRLADFSKLSEMFPQHQQIIERLSHSTISNLPNSSQDNTERENFNRQKQYRLG